MDNNAASGQSLFGLIEAGGTKFVAGVAHADGRILTATQVPTTTPEKTISSVIDWLRKQTQYYGNFKKIGIASFGPLQLNNALADWGHITNTPKPHWSGADIAGPFAAEFGCDVAIDTDVNGAAMAESQWGAGQGYKTVIYLTIGTGIGGGAIVDGKILHGKSHPEMGHMRVAIHPQDTGFSGNCPAHGACLEGLASGPAIIKRWGASLSGLAADHEANAIIAFYLAQAICTLQAIFEPDRIIMGGGVMASEGLIDLVRTKATELGGGYFVSDAKQIICKPGLGTNSGLLGALALAGGSA
jgi:fructokinase